LVWEVQKCRGAEVLMLLLMLALVLVLMLMLMLVLALMLMLMLMLVLSRRWLACFWFAATMKGVDEIEDWSKSRNPVTRFRRYLERRGWCVCVRACECVRPSVRACARVDMCCSRCWVCKESPLSAYIAWASLARGLTD
jgi:hypothetical protein